MAMAASTSAPESGSGSGEIVVEDVSYSIRDRQGRPAPLVRNCSFRAERGYFTVLVGPSGCGKTTLMNMIAGYFRPDSGRIQLDGGTVAGPGWDRLMVFQETALFPWMTTLDNVVYGPMVRGLKPLPEIRREASALLVKFGLGEFKDRYPRDLSGAVPVGSDNESVPVRRARRSVGALHVFGAAARFVPRQAVPSAARPLRPRRHDAASAGGRARGGSG